MGSHERADMNLRIDVSEPAEDKALEEYLRRKSALSMGYKRLYVEETTPPELDRAVTARARRALRWLVPALLAGGIAVALITAANFGVNAWMGAMVAAEKNLKERREAQRKKQDEERAKQPVTVIIDANANPPQATVDTAARKQIDQIARTEWIEKIETLKREGKTAEANEELKRFQQAYPNAVK